MWADVRRAAPALVATLVAGCGLVLDTTPPNPPPDGGPACTVDDDCSHDACGGFERCVAGACVQVIAPVDCDDGIECTTDDCTDGACRHLPDDAACTDGKVCIPAEGGCVTPKACSVPSDCDDGDVCTAAQDCVNDVCVIPSGQTDLVCPPFEGCGVIGCDAALGCVVTGTDLSLCAAVEDKVACTLTECDANGTCVDRPSDDVCETFGKPNCFVPVCDPENTYANADSGCIFRPDDAFCSDSDPASGCATSICAEVDGANADGCVRQVVPGVCMDASSTCSLESGLCTSVATVDCTESAQCDDGDPCNGQETCDVGSGFCQAGEPPCQGSTGSCLRLVCDPINLGDLCVTLPSDDCFGLATP